MEKRKIFQQYTTMSAEDQRTFDRWLKANAALGLILGAGLVAMALVGSNSAGSRDAVLANRVLANGVFANGKKVSDVVATGQIRK